MKQTFIRPLFRGLQQIERRWHRHLYSGIRFSERVEVMPRRSYGAHEQQFIDIFRPRSAGSLPLVILVPGAFFCGLHMQSLQSQIKALTHDGFAVALISYRTAPEALYPTQLKDLSIALRWLNHNRQTLQFAAGFYCQAYNAGANLLLNYLNALEQPYLQEACQLNLQADKINFKACALIDGLYDLDTAPFIGNTWQKKLVPLVLGSQDQHALRAIASPAQHLTSVVPPLLLCSPEKNYGLAQLMTLKQACKAQKLLTSGRVQLASKAQLSQQAQQQEIMQFFNTAGQTAKVRQLHP